MKQYFGYGNRKRILRKMYLLNSKKADQPQIIPSAFNHARKRTRIKPITSDFPPQFTLTQKAGTRQSHNYDNRSSFVELFYPVVLRGGTVLGCRVDAKTRSQVRPCGFMVRGDLATSSGMGSNTMRLLHKPTEKPV